jgi:hypothetical protein
VFLASRPIRPKQVSGKLSGKIPFFARLNPLASKLFEAILNLKIAGKY